MNLPYHIRLIVQANAFSAFQSMADAEEGDLSRLAKRVERGAVLSDQELAFIARHLRGEIKKPRHRPVKRATRWRQESMAAMVYVLRHLRGGKQDAAVMEAESQFKVGRSTIMEALAMKRRDPEKERLFDEMTKKVAEAAVTGIPNLPVVDVPLPIPGVTFDLSPGKSGTSSTESPETGAPLSDKSPAISSRSKVDAKSPRKFQRVPVRRPS